MVAHFAEKVPSVAQRSSENWASVGAQLSDIYERLRKDDLTHEARRQLYGELAFQAGMMMGERMRWHRDDTANYVIDDNGNGI